MAIFAALTIAVTSNSSLAADSRAFKLADQLRAPWLDHAARLVTTLGLIAVVGPVVLLAAVWLIRAGHLYRACALAGGAVLTWVTVWITKAVVDRPRPPAPLVHTAGESFPSAHAGNSMAWPALGLALGAMIGPRGGRVTAIVGGALLALLVGLSRIYLRAHYLSDVLAGEALATAMYAAAALGALLWQRRRSREEQP